MDLLEHPLEAVAFRLYSLPDASSVATGAAAWTCLAAVLAAAAAAGLWRLRSAAVSTAAAKPLGLDPRIEEEAPPAPLSGSERWSEPPAAPSPKERYTAYYRDACRVGCCDDADDDGRGDDGDDREDDAEERDDDDDDCGGGAHRNPPQTTTEPFGWEAAVVRSLPLSPTAAEMRLGPGPGRYRSPRALGGSVVQLWDQAAGGGLTPTASPRRRGRVF